MSRTERFPYNDVRDVAPDAGVDDDAVVDDDTDVGDDFSEDGDPLFAALLSRVARTPTLLSGTTLGRYRIDDVLGAGGMGVVYAAHDATLSRDVALKVLKVPDVDRVLHEARAVAALHHEGVCAVWDSGVVDDVPFLALERLTGETLRERLARGPLDDESAHAIALQIARALAHAHTRGVVHGDLKPENVMVTNEGRTKLLDLGIASRADDDGGMRGGTPGYLPPEDPRGAGARAKTNDVYAFGVVVGELLTGTRGTPLLGLPRRWRAIVDGCLHANLGRRFANGTALVRELEKMETTRARRRALVLAGAAVMVVLSAFALVPEIVQRVAGQSPFSSGASVDVGPDLVTEARFRAGTSALLSGDREAARAAFEEVLARGSTHPYPALLLLATDPAGAHVGGDLAHIRARSSGRDRAHDVARFVLAARATGVAPDQPLEKTLEIESVDDMARVAHALFAQLDGDFLGQLLVASAIAPRGSDDEGAARARTLLRKELFETLGRDAPDVPLVALHRAWGAVRLDDGADARRILDEAVLRAPGNPFLLMELAEVTTAIDPARARAMLDAVVEKRPSDIYARLMRVEARASDGDIAGAKEDLWRIVDGPFASAARGRGAIMFALYFSSRGYVDDARALIARAEPLVKGTATEAELERARLHLAADARALGVESTTSAGAAPPVVGDALHASLALALAPDTTAAERTRAARAVVMERAACVERTFFGHLVCRSALARAALVVVESDDATNLDRDAARAIVALFPVDVAAPTIARLRDVLAVGP